MQNTQSDRIDPWYLANLVCPVTGEPLRYAGRQLVSPNGGAYPVVAGVPIMLVGDAVQTLWVADASRRADESAMNDNPDDPYFVHTLGISPAEAQELRELIRRNSSPVDPVVSFLIGATNGNLYKDLIGKLDDYPIPELRLQHGGGKILLDVGCNWGRWCIAAARKGYSPVGIDPSLGAVLAGQRVAKQLGLDIKFVVCDSRFLPFRPGTFDVGFSYSVIQHFSRDDARTAVREIGKVLKPGGLASVPMATVFGIRCLYHQLRRRFRDGTGFEVRYWSIPALKRLFTNAIGPSSVLVDCYFGLGVQSTDRKFLPWHLKTIPFISEGLRRLSRFVPPMKYMADSVYILSRKSEV